VALVKSIEYVEVDIDNTNDPVTTNLTKGQDETQCVPFYSVRSDGALGDAARERDIKVEFIDNAGTPAVKCSHDLATDSNQVAQIFVIEFDSSITVEQREVTGLTDTTTSYNQTVNDVTTQSTAFFFFSQMCDVNAADIDVFANSMVKTSWNGASTTSINLSRSAGDGGLNGILYIVKCSSGEFTVEHLSDLAMGNTDETQNKTCASTVMADTFLLCSYSVNDPQDDMRDACWQANLTSTTNVRVKRGSDSPTGSGGAGTASIQVIECQDSEWDVQRAAMTLSDSSATNTDTITSIDQTKSFVQMLHNMGNISCGRNDSASGDQIENTICAIDFSANDTVRVRKKGIVIVNDVIEYEVIQFAELTSVTGSPYYYYAQQ
jgi:hypothetical protein